eukprot:3387432-Ditylum_brightwellii.AAC.1
MSVTVTRRMKKIAMLVSLMKAHQVKKTDKMMTQFAGRSLETHRMKNKPIGKGYKFFCLATKEETAAKSQQQEYKEDKKCLQGILSTGEYGYLMEGLRSKVIPEPQLLIKDH